MKREFLEGLGLEKTVIDNVMAEHGRSVEALKDQHRKSEEKLKELEESKERNEQLISRLEEEKRHFNIFRQGVINELIEENPPSSALAEAELERRLLEVENGKLKEAILKLKEENPDAFFKEKKKKFPVFTAVSAMHEGRTDSFHFSRVR